MVEGTGCSDTIIVSAPDIEKVEGGGGDDLIIVNGDVRKVLGGSGDDWIYGEQLSSTAAEEVISDKLAETGVSSEVFEIEGSALSKAERRKLRRNRGRSAKRGRASASAIMYGGMNTQVLSGGAGDDWIFGQRGNDEIFGGAGNDLVYGGPGDDIIYGQEGDDVVGGGFGTDDIDGNNGNDLVRGDATTDEISDTGGAGVDTISFATATPPGFLASMEPWANFPPVGGERGVYVRLDGIPCESGYNACNGGAATGGGYDVVDGWQFENIIGSPFADLLVGNAWNNRIDGGGGADVIYGSAGDDILIGGADGDFIHGEGGNDFAYGFGGFDNCVGVEGSSDCQGEATAVSPRDRSKISVGFSPFVLNPALRSTSLYLVGSSVHDSVRARWWKDPENGKEFFIFDTLPDTSAYFDTSADAYNPACGYSPTQVVCEIPAFADALVLAGLEEPDQLNIHDGNIGPWTSTVLQGGDGSDSIWGSETTEDVLIDGEGVGNDYLISFAFDDVLVNSAGKDTLQGGLGNDLILSVEICGGDYLHGAAVNQNDAGSVNNASWAKLPSSQVVASAYVPGVGYGQAGNGYNNGPYCANPGGLSALFAIDDLEGSDGNDRLEGDWNANSILGRNGNDWIFGGNGDDFLSGMDGADRMLAGVDGRAEGVDSVVGGGGIDLKCEVDSLDTLKSCP